MSSYSLTFWKSALFGGRHNVMSWDEEDSHREESSWSSLLLQSGACYLPSFPSISLGLRDGLSSACRQGMLSLCGRHQKLARPSLLHSTVASPHLWGQAVFHTAVRIARADTRAWNTFTGLKRGNMKYSFDNLPCLSEKFCLIHLCFWFW